MLSVVDYKSSDFARLIELRFKKRRQHSAMHPPAAARKFLPLLHVSVRRSTIIMVSIHEER
jgi:hypothetical protein